MLQSCGALLAMDEDYDVEDDDRGAKNPVTPRDESTERHPAGTMQVRSSQTLCEITSTCKQAVETFGGTGLL